MILHPLAGNINVYKYVHSNLILISVLYKNYKTWILLVGINVRVHILKPAEQAIKNVVKQHGVGSIILSKYYITVLYAFIYTINLLVRPYLVLYWFERI